MEITPVTGTKEGDSLHTKYYCKVEHLQDMSVVMEMKSTSARNIEPLPLRYVLVIDVSGSMDGRVGIDQRTLIQRVQLFAELAVRKMNPRDYIAVVTFSESAYVEIPLTKMTTNNKLMIRDKLKGLSTRTNTNLESGLIMALQVIDTAPNLFRPSRDCIILFTDGEANEGELNAKRLIRNYKQKQANMNRNSCVPVSAFTIGGYHPDLLIEISRHLGSDSFIWLNDEDDFEADMLIPIFLRETTHISDVKIRIESRLNSYFQPVDHNAAYLKNVEYHNVKIRKNKKKKKKKEPTVLSYFLHSLPDDCTKNLNFYLALPQLDLDGVKIVDVTVQYLDANMMPQTIQDEILLTTTTLMTSITQDSVAAARFMEPAGNTLDYAHFKQVSAFIMLENKPGTSWNEAQEVILKVAEEECKVVGVSSIENAKQHTDGNAQLAHASFRDAFEEINTIRNRTVRFIQEGSETKERLDTMIKTWSSAITNANNIAAKKDKRNFSLLSSMASSISTESPTGGGIFRGKQPFMTEVLEQKLLEEKKNLKIARHIQAANGITVSNIKHQFRKVADVGDIEKMEECLRDLNAMKLFEYGVEDDYIKYVEREIEHRNELQKIKKNLQASIADQDVSETERLVARMKELRDLIDLEFTNDDADALQRAMNQLSIFRRKRALRGDIASNMPYLDLPLIPANVVKISSTIEKLEAMRNEARQYTDVFTERDNTALNVAIANLGEARKEMNRIKRVMDGLVEILNLPSNPENFESLVDAAGHMKTAKAEAEIYDGLFGEKEENLLQRAGANVDQLKRERDNLQDKIDNLMPSMLLPMLPRNYEQLSNALEEFLSVKKKAIRFKELFTPEHEAALNQASEFVAILKTKREELQEKISICIPDIGLSKFPANLDRLKRAVDQMSKARDESKGFEGIFSDKHAEMLQKGIASLKILEAEKQEIIENLTTSLTQINLPMIPSNHEKISLGVGTMNKIASLAKEFGLYEKEYDSILEQATFNRDVLTERKEQICKEIENVKTNLQLPAIPDNLIKIRLAIDKMKHLKESSIGFENVFTHQNEIELFEATANLEHLTRKVEQLTAARHKLEEAVNGRNFIKLKHAIKRANRAPFFNKDDLKEPRKLMNFLDPNERIDEVTNAMKHGDVEILEEALMNMKDAGVINDSLEDQARHKLKKLRKQRKREEKERRRIERERARRQREMDKQTENVSHAIETRDIEYLEDALQTFENSEFDETELPLVSEAKELLEHLKIERMRRRLQDGVSERNFNMLLDALIDADYGKFETHLQKEYDEAKELLLHLQEMMRLRDAIAKLTRSSISEVHGYPKPPRAIKKIMISIFVILGESPKEMKKWANIQALLGRLDRTGITKRVLRFQLKDLSPEVAEKADAYLKDLSLAEAEEISSVAAMFYAWAKYVVNEVNFLQKESARRQLEHANSEQEKYEHEEFDSEHEDSSSEKSNGEYSEKHNNQNVSTVDEAGYYADDDFA